MAAPQVRHPLLAELRARRRPARGRPSKSPDYQARLESHFYQFASDIFSAIILGQLGLRSFNSDGDPYIDLSPYVRTVSDYSTAVGDLANNLEMLVGRPDQKGDPDPNLGDLLDDKVFNINDGILPRENDVIMVLCRYPGEQSFTPEYLGMSLRS